MSADGAESPLTSEAVEDHAPKHVLAVEPVIATLIAGISYRLGDTVWNRERGHDAHPVDPETEMYLREHAPSTFVFSNDDALVL